MNYVTKGSKQVRASTTIHGFSRACGLSSHWSRLVDAAPTRGHNGCMGSELCHSTTYLCAFSKGLKNKFKTTVVNEPSVFELLTFHYIFQSSFVFNQQNAPANGLKSLEFHNYYKHESIKHDLEILDPTVKVTLTSKKPL